MADSEQSYTDRLTKGQTLHTHPAAFTPGYAPPASNISLAGLNALLSQFRALNTFVTSLYVDLSAARSSRKMLYDAPDALADKFQAIKAAIKGQYGTASSQWDEVKGMTW